MPYTHYAAPVTAENSSEIASTCLTQFGVMLDKVVHPAIPSALYSVNGPMIVVASWREHNDPHTTRPFHVMLITFEEFLRDRLWLDSSDTIGPFCRNYDAR